MATTMTTADATTVARKCWRTMEPYHGMIYFVPEAAAEYEAIGVTGRSGYFGSRSAAMGAVGPLVVHATFFNFHPRVVERAMDGLWDAVAPEELLVARHRAADQALRRLLGDAAGTDPDGGALREAVDLLRPVVEAARQRAEGRPLFAGHARLPEPDQPHLALWWAITLLREFRGDGHVAALTHAGLSGVEALIVHGASGEVPPATLRTTRGWPQDEWDAGADRLRVRGLLDPDGNLSPAGAELRAGIEARTDELAAPAWQAITVDDAARIRELVRPHSKAITAGAF